MRHAKNTNKAILMHTNWKLRQITGRPKSAHYNCCY